MIHDEMASIRTLVRNIMSTYGEFPLQPLEAITYDEARILGERLPDRPPPAT